jgi:hypothetical protein
MQALIFGYLFIKKKVRALRRLTEESPSLGQRSLRYGRDDGFIDEVTTNDAYNLDRLLRRASPQ